MLIYVIRDAPQTVQNNQQKSRYVLSRLEEFLSEPEILGLENKEIIEILEKALPKGGRIKSKLSKARGKSGLLLRPQSGWKMTEETADDNNGNESETEAPRPPAKERSFNVPNQTVYL
jgi:hypothetical protein